MNGCASMFGVLQSRHSWRAALLLACGLAGLDAIAATTLTVGELDVMAAKTGSVPVLFHTDTAVSAVQMDVSFDAATLTGRIERHPLG